MNPQFSATYPRRYAIIGTGALGGFYGARLQRAGFEVHYLLHRDYAHVRAHGLRIDSVDGDFVLPKVNAWAKTTDMPPCDVIIVALKTTQNHRLPELLPPLLHEHSVVLVLQNGLDVEADAAAVVGPQRVIGGLCFLCANKAGPGHICHLDYGAINLGEYAPNMPDTRLNALTADFRRANIAVDTVANLRLARWRKLLWNIPFNGLSVVLRASTAEMMADDGIRALAADLMAEVRHAAAQQACFLDASEITAMLAATARMKAYKTSMMLDYEAQRPLELDAIFARPLAVSSHMPLTHMLYRQLSFLESAPRPSKNSADLKP
jgi:2-dehydropantoate 2-reductase